MTTAPSSRPPTRFAHAMRAMRHRNYRLFFYGQGISLIGTWMTRVATGWLVFRLTHSAALLGIISFAGQIPTFFFSAFAGAWIERVNRHRVLTITQVLALLQATALATLTLTGHITVTRIFWLSVAQGFLTAVDTPTRHAFLVEMVEGREDLSSAIALTSSLVTVARLIGPAAAGFLIAAWGEGWCFGIDAISYIFVVVSLLMMRVTAKPVAARPSMRSHMKQGWQYVNRFRPIRDILLLLALVSVMGIPYMVLLPIFAARVLHGGPHMLGALSGAAGLGALAASIMLAARKSVRGLIGDICTASALFGASLIALGLSRSPVLSCFAMLLVGYGMTRQMTSSNTVVQTLVTEDKRARVMSYYTIAFLGMTPFGSLLAGVLANRIGAPHTVMLTGACCLLGAGWFSLQLPRLRREAREAMLAAGTLPAHNGLSI